MTSIRRCSIVDVESRVNPESDRSRIVVVTIVIISCISYNYDRAYKVRTTRCDLRLHSKHGSCTVAAGRSRVAVVTDA